MSDNMLPHVLDPDCPGLSCPYCEPADVLSEMLDGGKYTVQAASAILNDFRAAFGLPSLTKAECQYALETHEIIKGTAPKK